MPGYLYNEYEVLERKPDVRVMGNGTVTAGAKYINNTEVRVDIIIMKRSARIERVNSKLNENGCVLESNDTCIGSALSGGGNTLISRPSKHVL